MRKQRKFVATALLIVFLAACDPLSLGTTIGGVVGLSILEERSAEAGFQDRKIQVSIHNNLSKQGLDKDGNEIFVMVYESEVMLVGFVSEAANSKKILEIAENTPGVQRLYNDFRVQKITLSDYSYDRILGLELSTRLSLEKGVHEVNYVVRIVDGIAYMMGIALSSEELEQVRAVTASIKGMRGMVSRIKVRPPNLDGEMVEEPIETTLDARNVEAYTDTNPVDTVEIVPVEVVKSAPIDFFGSDVDTQPLPPLN